MHPSMHPSINNYCTLYSKTGVGWGGEEGGQEIGADLLSKRFEIFSENVSLS